MWGTQTQANAKRALYTAHHRVTSNSYPLTVYIGSGVREGPVCLLKSFIIFPSAPNEF
jgi:hypothetical protein